MIRSVLCSVFEETVDVSDSGASSGLLAWNLSVIWPDILQVWVHQVGMRGAAPAVA